MNIHTMYIYIYLYIILKHMILFKIEMILKNLCIGQLNFGAKINHLGIC